MLTQEQLKELLHYDPETGIFTWKVSRGRCKSGSVAGTANVSHTSSQILYKKRVKIKLLGKLEMAHRLAWLYMTGSIPIGEIDHINRDSMDNRFDNLRDVTHKQNVENTELRVNNTSGFMGVTYSVKNQNWYSQIQHCGERMFIGTFNTPEEASTAYEAMRDKLFTHHKSSLVCKPG